MIQIFGIFSPYVFRVRAALVFKGLAFEHVSVNLRNRSDEFKALTPVGKIPVLKDEDGTVLWDSLNIVRYLDMKYPSYKMIDGDAKNQARIGNVTALADKLNTDLTPLYLEKIGLPAPTEEVKAKARILVAEDIEKLHTLLNGQPFFTDKFSHADSAVLSAIGSVQYFGEAIGALAPWFGEKMADEKIRQMFPAEDEKGVREI